MNMWRQCVNYKYWICFLFVVLSSFLSGCSLLSPVKTPHTDTYILNSIPTDVPHRATKRHALWIAPVTSEPLYNKTEMAYTIKPYQIAYFAKNKWVEPPAQMLQPLIAQTLQNTHSFNTVSALTVTTQHDLLLHVHLVELQQIFLADSSALHLELRAELFNTKTAHPIATKNISVTEPVFERSPYGGVVAANRATAKALQALALFCIRP